MRTPSVVVTTTWPLASMSLLGRRTMPDFAVRCEYFWPCSSKKSTATFWASITPRCAKLAA